MTAMVALGRRAVACPGWRWLPGAHGPEIGYTHAVNVLAALGIEGRP